MKRWHLTSQLPVKSRTPSAIRTTLTRRSNTIIWMVTRESVPLRIAQIRPRRCLRTTWGSSSSPRRICTASLGSKDNFTCHHSMNARWNSFVMLCAGKRNFSRTAMSVRYVCQDTRNSMRVRCIKRQWMMLSCASTYLSLVARNASLWTRSSCLM